MLRGRRARRSAAALLAAGLLCLLCGCIALPGREPFGEKTYSDEKARSVYDGVRAELDNMSFSEWNGFSIETNDGSVSHDLYSTEEYTVAWHEDSEKSVLWYKGRLYRYENGKISWRDMPWEELDAQGAAQDGWDLARALTAQDGAELTYKYIPMSEEGSYLLKAQFSEKNWNGLTRRFPRLFFRMDENDALQSFAVHWQEGAYRVTDICFYPYKGSSELQAERKIWIFAHDIGLIEQPVTSLEKQRGDREWCRGMIESINFEDAVRRGSCLPDMAFPSMPAAEQ